MAQMMDQAADGMWLVTGTDVNWVLVTDGDEVTLAGTGEPRDWPRVLSSLLRAVACGTLTQQRAGCFIRALYDQYQREQPE